MFILSLSLVLIVYSHSVDPWKLCVGVKYYVAHVLHSTMQCIYYVYGSTANFGPTALICIKIYIQKNGDVTDLHGVGNFNIERVIR